MDHTKWCNSQMENIVEEAVTKAGSQRELAAMTGATQQEVSKWVKARRIPRDRCPAVELHLGIVVERLRPDAPWLRVQDQSWPVAGGRPVLDIAARLCVASAAQPKTEGVSA